MRDWQFYMILLGVYYQVENLFPVPHSKWNNRFCSDNDDNKELRGKSTAQCIALDVYGRLAIFHGFSVSVLPI